jgi:hypothetical protein
MIWSIPVVALASTLAGWLAVRPAGMPAAPALAVSASTTLAAASDVEIGDPSLRALISRFADSARAQNGR